MEEESIHKMDKTKIPTKHIKLPSVNVKIVLKIPVPISDFHFFLASRSAGRILTGRSGTAKN